MDNSITFSNSLIVFSVRDKTTRKVNNEYLLLNGDLVKENSPENPYDYFSGFVTQTETMNAKSARSLRKSSDRLGEFSISELLTQLEALAIEAELNSKSIPESFEYLDMSFNTSEIGKLISANSVRQEVAKILKQKKLESLTKIQTPE